MLDLIPEEIQFHDRGDVSPGWCFSGSKLHWRGRMVKGAQNLGGMVIASGPLFCKSWEGRVENNADKGQLTEWL